MRKALLLFVLLGATGCWRGLIYHPTELDEPALAELTKIPGWQLQRVQGEETLVGMVRRATGPDEPWIVYFGGNGLSLADSQAVLRRVVGNHGWGLATWAYRGYDTSGGSPTQAGLQADALVIAHYLFDTEKVPPKKLILMGQSLGTGIAAPLAAALAHEGKAPAGLALVSGFTSVAQAFSDAAFGLPVGWTVADPYDTLAVLPGINCPVLLIHGTKDTVVGVQHSDQLAAALGEQALYVRIEGRGHNDIWLAPEAANSMVTFVERHTAPPHP